ncbi:hypothetical protein SprV_0602182000 [Sparganum proliferum]
MAIVGPHSIYRTLSSFTLLDPVSRRPKAGSNTVADKAKQPVYVCRVCLIRAQWTGVSHNKNHCECVGNFPFVSDMLRLPVAELTQHARRSQAFTCLTSALRISVSFLLRTFIHYNVPSQPTMSQALVGHHASRVCIIVVHPICFCKTSLANGINLEP